MTDTSHQLRVERRDERRIVAPFRGDIAVRLIVTFVGFSALWAAIVIAASIALPARGRINAEVDAYLPRPSGSM
jgi:hypothetical protein